MAAELHLWLAFASAGVVSVIGLEAAWRAARGVQPGRAAARLENLMLVTIGVTIAGGLGIIAGGGTPRELLHVVYAVFAFGIVPVAGRIAEGWEPRRRSLTTVFAAAVTLVAMLRLATTG